MESIDVPCKVLLVANGSTPEFISWLERSVRNRKRKEEDCVIVETPKTGLGHAYNLGIDRCRTEYVLLMDSDCTFSPGCINTLLNALSEAALSKGFVRFLYSDPLSKTVAKLRHHTTSSFVNAYSPPLAFSKTVVRHYLNFFFHEELAWSEDFDFNLRVQKANLKIAYRPEAVVFHPPISLFEDLRSASNYGFGYGIGVCSGIYPTPMKKSVKGQISRNWDIFKEVRIKNGFFPACYSLFWSHFYRRGYARATRHQK